MKPETWLLVIEVADTSLDHDLGLKARLYAVFGVRELWVIDAVKRETHVHRRLLPEGYAGKLLAPPSGTPSPEFAPELAISLGSPRKARS